MFARANMPVCVRSALVSCQKCLYARNKNEKVYAMNFEQTRERQREREGGSRAPAIDTREPRHGGRTEAGDKRLGKNGHSNWAW